MCLTTRHVENTESDSSGVFIDAMSACHTCKHYHLVDNVIYCVACCTVHVCSSWLSSSVHSENALEWLVVSTAVSQVRQWCLQFCSCFKIRYYKCVFCVPWPSIRELNPLVAPEIIHTTYPIISYIISLISWNLLRENIPEKIWDQLGFQSMTCWSQVSSGMFSLNKFHYSFT